VTGAHRAADSRPIAPRLCPGGTVVCVGGGPSLTPADVEYCRERAFVVAVNDAYRLAPFALALYASDSAWWAQHRGVPTFAGPKFGLERSSRLWGVTVLQDTGDEGIELEPTGLRSGRNSGAAAINLAVHFGAIRILLLGYDMQAPGGEARSHWFGQHTAPLRGGSPYDLFREKVATMAAPLASAGVTVINCSRETALTCFPRQALEEALR
jgi:hypothetical protein